jgi:fumarate reductase subunit D
MRAAATTGILVVVVGVVFLGQGLGIVRNQSFMVDDIRWSAIGVVMVLLGTALALWSGRRSR